MSLERLGGEGGVHVESRRYLLMALEEGTPNTSKLLRANADGDLKVSLDGETLDVGVHPVTISGIPTVNSQTRDGSGNLIASTQVDGTRRLNVYTGYDLSAATTFIPNTTNAFQIVAGSGTTKLFHINVVNFSSNAILVQFMWTSTGTPFMYICCPSQDTRSVVVDSKFLESGTNEDLYGKVVTGTTPPPANTCNAGAFYVQE